MTIDNAILHLENMKWLLGVNNTTVDDIPLPKVIDDIIGLLNPHVMTLEEVKECDYCWLETKSWPDRDEFLPVLWIPSDNEDVVVCFTNGRNCDYACDTDTYNIDWRCWNTRPTEEQRKAVAWIEA